VGPGHEHDAELRIASTDLERLLSDDIHPAMLIAGGRAEANGPVRKFLRIVPVLRGAAREL